MADGFEIQVPITIKGGNEGEKVGIQIGEKIASQLKKSFKIAGISGGTKGTTSPGISKGLSGIVTKLGAVSLAVGAAVGLLAKASPYLKGILSIFGRAFMIFFRPFGDFLATLLRPLAILLLKLAVAWMKLTRPIIGAAKEGAEAAPQIKTTGTFVDPAIELANWALKLGGAIGGVIYEIGRAAFDLGGKIGQWLYDEVIKPAGDWIYEKLSGLWNWIDNLIERIKDWIKSFSPGSWKEEETYGNTQTELKKGLYSSLEGGSISTNNRSITLNPTINFNGNIDSKIDVNEMIRNANTQFQNDLKQRGIF